MLDLEALVRALPELAFPDIHSGERRSEEWPRNLGAKHSLAAMPAGGHDITELGLGMARGLIGPITALCPGHVKEAPRAGVQIEAEDGAGIDGQAIFLGGRVERRVRDNSIFNLNRLTSNGVENHVLDEGLDLASLPTAGNNDRSSEIIRGCKRNDRRLTVCVETNGLDSAIAEPEDREATGTAMNNRTTK